MSMMWLDLVQPVRRPDGKELPNRPLGARFTDVEFRLMQTHPGEGARILLNTPGVPETAIQPVKTLSANLP